MPEVRTRASRSRRLDSVAIRRVRPSDSAGLSAFYASLSPDSSHARFLGHTRGIGGGLARSFCTLDHMHDEGFVAVTSDEREERIVGHLCLARVSPVQLELGVAVSDEFQGKRIGRRLFSAAIAWAREHRFASVVATCFADNSRVLALLTSAPEGAAVTPADGGVVDVVIPLESPLPRPQVMYPQVRGGRGMRRSAEGKTASRPLHVFWRRKPQPERVAGD